MATTTITRIYTTYEKAARVVEELEAANIPHRDITLLSNSSQHAGLTPYNATTSSRADREDTYDTAATTGAVGGVVGLITGLGLIAIPGLGPIAAAGWLGATLAGFTFGTAGGAAVAGISESLSKHGVDSETATRSAQAVQAGGTLVAVRVDNDRISTVESIMGNNDAAFEVDSTGTATKTRVA